MPQVQVQSRAPAAAFGVQGVDQLGAAVQGAAGDLMGEVVRQQESELAVRRAEALTSYNETAFQEFNRIQTEEDLADPDTVQRYNQFLQEKQNELLLQHPGHEESRNALQMRLEGVRSGMFVDALGAGFQAQRAKVTRVIGEQTNAIAAAAIESPERMPEHFASLDAAIEDFGPALTEEEEATLKSAGRAQIITSAYDRLLTMPGGGVATGALFDKLPFEEITDRMWTAESGQRQFRANGEPLISPAGAIGFAQVTPAAAQEAAAELGIPYDLERLKTDEAYNKTLGETYYRMQLETFGGDHTLALSAYNAGPENTRFYIKKAIEKHGKNYTPAQFVATVEEVQKRVKQSRGEEPVSETANYIRKIMGGGKTQRFTAEDLLNMPGLDRIIPAEQRRTMQNALIKLQTAEEKRQLDLTKKIDEATIILGREPTPMERARLAGVAGPESAAQTMAEKGAMLEMALDRPLTPEEWQRLGGIDAPAGKTPSWDLQQMMELAPVARGGAMSEAQERAWQASITNYQQPRTITDEFGNQVTIRPELPAFVQEIEAQRAAELPPGQQIEARQGAYVQRHMPPVDVGRQIEEREGQVLREYLDGQRSIEEAEGAIPAETTLFDLAQKGFLTGPIAAAQDVLGRTPGIGGAFEDEALRRARRFVPLIQRDLIRVLQNNPRYADAERQAIENEIDIKPSIWDRPETFITNLIALEDALQLRLNTAQKTAVSRGVGPEERLHASNVANGITHFLTRLGLPPRVTSPGDWKALKPGTVYIDPNYKIRTRGADQETENAAE